MEKETSRVEAFSDGVFAIALTLLILGIKVPERSFNRTPRQVQGRFPEKTQSSDSGTLR